MPWSWGWSQQSEGSQHQHQCHHESGGHRQQQQRYILNTLPRTEQCPALRLQEEDVNTAISQRSVLVTVAQARRRLRDRVSGRPRLGKSALEGNTDSLPSYNTLFPNNTTEDVFVAPLILLRYISLRPDTAS